MIDKCQLSWDWLQQFMKEAREFVGAHVLSMVRAYYPLIDFTRFAKGYPKEVGVHEVGELWDQLTELATMIIGDINLCGIATPPSQRTPMKSALGSSSRPPGTVVSTSQSQVGQSTSKEQPEPVVTTSQTPAAQARPTKATP
jgi:hypothetical protein